MVHSWTLCHSAEQALLKVIRAVFTRFSALVREDLQMADQRKAEREPKWGRGDDVKEGGVLQVEKRQSSLGPR